MRGRWRERGFEANVCSDGARRGAGVCFRDGVRYPGFGYREGRGGEAVKPEVREAGCPGLVVSV